MSTTFTNMGSYMHAVDACIPVSTFKEECMGGQVGVLACRDG
jgi:hypothetical protein